VFELKPGVPGIVAGIRGGESSPLDPMLLTRLGELGFLAGESVTLLCRGPGGREPLAVQTGDTVVALRAVEARCILIED
jgi:ferrous iron transport protein A